MFWGRRNLRLFLAIAGLTVLFTPLVNAVPTLADAPSSLIISEIKINNDAAGYNEYIELYNGTGGDIELANYHLVYFNVTSPGVTDNPTYDALPNGLLAPGSFLVLAQNPGQIPRSSQLSLSSLKDTGGFVQLAAIDGSITDQIAWSNSKTGLPAGVVTAPASNQSLQKPLNSTGVPQTNAGWNAAAPSPQSVGLLADDAASIASNASLAPPQITELLPNPNSQQTDDNDEFVELYNLNDQPYDLTGYVLQAGTITLHNYTVPAGTVLPPHAFTAFYFSQTHLSLSNTGGQVKLLNSDQQMVDQSDPYGAAVDGQAWAFIDTGWQWTGSPTPGAVNMLTSSTSGNGRVSTSSSKSPKAVTAKTTTSKAKNKTASKKTNFKVKKSTGLGSGASTTDSAQNASDVQPAGLIHPWILASIGGVALLYAAYEYREDIFNKLHQFKQNRSTRRATRPKP